MTDGRGEEVCAGRVDASAGVQSVGDVLEVSLV